MQPRQLVVVETAGAAQRMQPAPPEGFVDVDVPEPGDRPLVEEGRLERGPAALQAQTEASCGERAERLGADTGI